MDVVQLRLMGSKTAVKAVAEALLATGLVTITGTADNRFGTGIRAYGIALSCAGHTAQFNRNVGNRAKALVE